MGHNRGRRCAKLPGRRGLGIALLHKAIQARLSRDIETLHGQQSAGRWSLLQLVPQSTHRFLQLLTQYRHRGRGGHRGSAARLPRAPPSPSPQDASQDPLRQLEFRLKETECPVGDDQPLDQCGFKDGGVRRARGRAPRPRVRLRPVQRPTAPRFTPARGKGAGPGAALPSAGVSRPMAKARHGPRVRGQAGS
uniref:Uncharacterized protein n=1 Tax=Crocodylus porosus TaxID=8502 RepID=A0A7M4E413_CROPO